jgi:hypothetical protein
MRELLDQGMTLDASALIVELQDKLDRAYARTAELESELATRREPDDGPAEPRTSTASSSIFFLGRV